jgi:hypothetical protein
MVSKDKVKALSHPKKRLRATELMEIKTRGEKRTRAKGDMCTDQAVSPSDELQGKASFSFNVTVSFVLSFNVYEIVHVLNDRVFWLLHGYLP